MCLHWSKVFHRNSSDGGATGEPRDSQKKLVHPSHRVGQGRWPSDLSPGAEASSQGWRHHGPAERHKVLPKAERGGETPWLPSSNQPPVSQCFLPASPLT